MKHKKRILIDIDDVCAQFRLAYLQTLFFLFGIKCDVKDAMAIYDIDKMFDLAPKQHAQLWKTINGPGWAGTLEPMPGAVKHIKELARYFEVSFVSKNLKTSPTWVYDRTLWLKKHFGQELADNYHATGQKYAVDANWLIEDRVDHVEKWLADRKEHSKRNFKALLFAWPYNENAPEGVERLPDWDAIAAVLHR